MMLPAQPVEACPGYTSYPTADRFTSAFGYRDYLHAVADLRTRGGGRPLSLYVHIPSCVTKTHAKAAAYLAYLKREIDMQGRLFAGISHVVQLHVGGAPTWLPDTQLHELVAHLRRSFPFAPEEEGAYAIEADARAVDAARVPALRRLRFNGIRFHVRDAGQDVPRAVVDAARAAAFRAVGIELGRTLCATLHAALDTVVDTAPDRIAIPHDAHLPVLERCAARLADAGYAAIGMGHYARPDDDLAIAQVQGRLRWTVQGYSAQPDMDLVACGMSAIGAVGATYCQNTSDHGAYVDCLDRNEVPIARGVRLTLDDVLRRSVIQRLMCQFELSIPAVEQAFPIVFPQYFAREMAALAQLAREGMVDLEEGWISVTPRGRLLVRDVCMVFDRYLAQPARAA